MANPPQLEQLARDLLTVTNRQVEAFDRIGFWRSACRAYSNASANLKIGCLASRELSTERGQAKESDVRPCLLVPGRNHYVSA